MKLILIGLLFFGGLGFAGYKVFDYFSEKKAIGMRALHKVEEEKARKKAVEEALVKYQAEHPAPALPAPGINPVAADVPDHSPVRTIKTVSEITVGSYVFKNRLVPPAPSFLKDENKVGMLVQTEEASNSWVWIGAPVLGSQIRDLAITYDVRQLEMDLDFVLVLVNTERLQARGLSMFYNEQANWLNALSLTADSGSLRISAGNVALDLTLNDSNTGLSLLSQPVIRCMDGHQWKFSTDSNVPVPKSEIIDGAIRNSVEFKPVGFGLDGVVRIVGDKVLLKVEQRNGSISPSANASTDVPIFNNQSLQTTCELGFGEWSVLGGLQVDKEEIRKGFFRNSLKASSDYLVVFVRPRLALEAPPAAVPVNPLQDDEHPLLESGLLPPRGWIDQEIKLVEDKIQRMKSRSK